MPRPSLVAAVVALPLMAWIAVAAFKNGPKDEVEAIFDTRTAEDRADAYLAEHFTFDPAQRDSALALVTPDRLDAFAYAWRALDVCTYTRTRRTEQRTRDDLLLNAVEIVTAHGPGTAQIVQQDSVAPFDFGYFSRYVSLNAPTYDPLHVETVALRARGLFAPTEDRYVFRIPRDTLAAGIPARIVELEALPNVGDGLNVRRMRLAVARNGGAILGVNVWRIDLGSFHREEAVVEAWLAPDAYGRLVPKKTRFSTLGKVPFREPMRFETTAYYDGLTCPER